MEEEQVFSEGDQIVSIHEFMEGIEAQQLEADLVLGGDEGKECTYEKGYMRRQAVFSCLTCTPGGNAGVCTACSLICHEGHKVVELWTRRRFRCDCGNEKFGEFKCKLVKERDRLNGSNVYNQNYGGLYCTCRRPYPDPENEDQGEMLQCCICEDWFHETHLGLPPSLQVPRDDEGEPAFDELICQSCISRCSFLENYPDLFVSPSEVDDEEAPESQDAQATKSAETGTAEVPSTETSLLGEPHMNGLTLETALGGRPVQSLQAGSIAEKIEPISAVEELYVSSTSHTGESSTFDNVTCKLKKTEDGSKQFNSEAENADTGGRQKVLEPGQAVFLTKSWRSELCLCDACKSTYAAKGVEFLLDKEDTLQEYEEAAKRKREEAMQKEDGTTQAFLQKLGHVQRMELVHGINDFTTELGSFLTPFGQNGKTVTRDDIDEFFQGLQKKRRLNSNLGPQ
ncbi:hypothetical protein R1sor_007074 [Riccia sorocarpa]|uniref:UBR-type domain-containing protein n=1 Tax=Riccia sorocarpa TaxID=122646 RepID=A0ABD3HPB5_9MARC